MQTDQRVIGSGHSEGAQQQSRREPGIVEIEAKAAQTEAWAAVREREIEAKAAATEAWATAREKEIEVKAAQTEAWAATREKEIAVKAAQTEAWAAAREKEIEAKAAATKSWAAAREKEIEAKAAQTDAWVAAREREIDPVRHLPPRKYPSCRHIERGLAFWGHSVTACCGNTTNGAMPTIVAPFTGDITAQAIMEGRARIITRHKAGNVVPECQGCAHLEEQEWGPNNLSPFLVDEVTTQQFTSCQIRCNYCYTVTQPQLAAPLSKAARTLPTLEQLIAGNLLAPNATVRFAGGEPTISPEFDTALTRLIDFGARCVVYTNAVKLSDAIMDALSQDKVELVLGIDAASIAVYKAIKKMNYNEKVWSNVAKYCAARLPNAENKVWAKFIFCIENYHEAAHFAERAAQAGVTHVQYDFDASRMDPDNLRAGIALPEEAAEYAALLRHECARRGIIVEFAQAGWGWLTSERRDRMERELQRLSAESTDAAAPAHSTAGAVA